MTHIVVNPGTGHVDGTSRGHAFDNMTHFVNDLNALGHSVSSFTGAPDNDYGGGRYCFTVAMRDGRTVEVQMPGLPADQVRWMNLEGQNIWDFPRLYVDGSSWVWQFALSACEPPEDDEDDW